MVGAPGINTNRGKVFVLEDNVLQFTILASDRAAEDDFGAAVAVQDGIIAVGAQERSGGISVCNA